VIGHPITDYHPLAAICYNIGMDALSEAQIARYRQTFHQHHADQYEAREARRQKALTAICPLLPALAATTSSIQALYLFGSITQPGQFHPHSDIDIGLVEATAEDYFTFWRELETALPAWFFDVRDVSDDSFFAQRVKETGLLIYERANPSPAS
jgi:predicted nucleotidyltransferase